MNWDNETFSQWSKRKSKWRKWFAWYPVLCEEENKWRWVEYVWTQFLHRSGTGTFLDPYVYHYNYRGLLSEEVSAITCDHREYMALVAEECAKRMKGLGKP